jgi:hypothetical protein
VTGEAASVNSAVEVNFPVELKIICENSGYSPKQISNAGKAFLYCQKKKKIIPHMHLKGGEEHF